MPRHAKGPRLWLRPARADSAAIWTIRDGSRRTSTGLGADASESEKAEALAVYLEKQRTKSVSTGVRDPSQILIDDVLAKYIRDHDVPYETELRITALRRFWSGKLLSEVNGDACREYVTFRRAENEEKKRAKIGDGAARRELEDFRAAINHHRREGLHDKIVSVILPPAGKRRERWLTRSEAAHLILTTWHYRERQNFRGTDRRTRRHVARFMVVARYMGSRASVICEASIEEVRPKDRAWIDLATGIFYGLPEADQETNKRRQVVRVPPPLLAHLRRWQAAGQRYPVEWNGKPVLRISKAHAAAVKAAGFGPDVTPHTWRHTLATWLAQTNINDKDAADYLAMTVETFHRVYRHQRPDLSASVHRALKSHGNDTVQI